MDTVVDMKYSFLQDDEPSDEQLQVIMQEVAEEACIRQKEAANQVIENIEREYTRAMQQNQQI